jgi:hypothetical protein
MGTTARPERAKAGREVSEGITTWEQYYQLDQLVFDAEDRLKTGSGPSGIHYELMNILRQLGAFANSREDAIRQGKKLLKAWDDKPDKP